MKALFKVCNLAQLDKTGKKNDMPRLTMESLNRFVGPGTEGHGHVIGTSACMQGHICETLLKPYWIREKSSDYQRKLDNLPHVYPADTLDKAQQEIDVTAASLKEAKDELNSIKAIAGKKVESKITRLQAKIEKLEAKSADTTEELGQLDVLLNEQASVNEANARMVELKPRENAENAPFHAENSLCGKGKGNAPAAEAAAQYCRTGRKSLHVCGRICKGQGIGCRI
jgi:hypothetical protein